MANSDKLLAKLAESHPDLPVHILHAHYGHMFADPPSCKLFFSPYT
jgi:hypothetical protein